MRTIVVATDLSPVAKNAALYAADMASTVGADLFLLHVYVPPVRAGNIQVPLAYDTWKKEAEREMVNLRRTVVQQSMRPVHVRWELRSGVYLPELKGACARLNPYAVVIGATGLNASNWILYGSHAIETLKHLPWPVICVPPDVHFNAIRKIGLACDLEHVQEGTPFHDITHLIADFRAELHVLYIGGNEPCSPGAVSGAGFLQDHLRAANPQFHFIEQKDVDEGILDFVESHGIDLLIVLPRRHRFLDALANRSLTRRFVLHHPVPLMAIHATQNKDGW